MKFLMSIHENQPFKIACKALVIFFLIVSVGKTAHAIDFSGATLYTSTTTSSAGSSTWNINFVVGGCSNSGVNTSRTYNGFEGASSNSVTLSNVVNANSSCHSDGNYHLNSFSTQQLYKLLANFASTTGFYFYAFCTQPTGQPNLCSTSGSGNFPIASSTAGGMTSYIEFYWDGSSITPLVATTTTDTSTHFVSVSPVDNAVSTNPVISFSANWHISDADLDSLTTVFSGPENKVTVTAQILDAQDSTWSQQILNWTLPLGTETSTSTGNYTFNGSIAHFNYDHNYKVTWQLVGSNYYNFFGPVFYVTKTIYFTVGSTTEAGHIRQVIASSTEATLNANNYANGYSLNACNPLSSDWNVTDCVLSMFIPDPDYYPKAVASLKTGFLARAPMGYATRFVSILSATSTTALPAFSVPVRIGPATTTDTLTVGFDMNDIVAGAGTVLDDTRDPYYGKNIKDIAEPIMQLLVAILLVYAVVRDLLGHKHSNDVAFRK